MPHIADAGPLPYISLRLLTGTQLIISTAQPRYAEISINAAPGIRIKQY